MLQKIINLGKSLYPTGRAFKMYIDGEFYKLNKGLAESEKRAYEDALSIRDSMLPDNSNFTADDATQWERRLGLITNGAVSLADRKLAIERKMNFPGEIEARQHYLYVEGQLQAAGFDVYVYENRFAVYPDGYVTQNPLTVLSDNLPYLGDELVVNGTFDSSSGWTFANGCATVSGGKLVFACGALDAGVSRSISIPANSGKYLLVFDVEGYTSGSVLIFLEDAGAGAQFSGTVRSSNGTFTQTIDSSTFTLDAATIIIQNNAFPATTLDVDNVSIKPIIYEALTDIPSIIQPQHGGVSQHGSFQGGYFYSNIVANHIQESRDIDFDIGDNLRSTFFIGGSPFGQFAEVDEERKEEFRQLICKLKPAQTVAFLFVTYI